MNGRPLTADAIVIGGGLHGCATALYLARAGVHVIVVEKDRVGRHASTANAGGVRRLGRALPEIPLADAALGIWHRIPDLVDDDCGFANSCQVKVAESEAELQVLRERRETVLGLGFSHEELIDRAELRELLPAIAPHCVGALVVRGDGHANPFLTVQAFKRKALALGVRILERAPVSALHLRGSIWRIRSARAALEAPIVINCAGAWGGRIAAMLGEHAPVDALALMLMITARVKPFVKPVVGAQGRTLSFKQFENGTVLIGGGYQGRAEPDRNVTHLDFRGLAASAATAAALFPNLAGVEIVRCWAGIEGQLPDGIPVIGASAAEGAYHAFGFCGHGFALGPIVGRVITELITSGKAGIPIDAFDIGRFARSIRLRS
jgi:glycine/D-amino acid oxidase-like deaminating enzyme